MNNSKKNEELSLNLRRVRKAVRTQVNTGKPDSSRQSGCNWSYGQSAGFVEEA